MVKIMLTLIAIVATVSGLALAHTADIEQVGSDNDAAVNQTGPKANVASILQNGDENIATVDQDSTGTGGGPNPNYVKPVSYIFSYAGGVSDRGINQQGNRNTAVVDQKAKNGTASITQDGDDNSATVNQEALVNGYNTGLVYQGGNNNSAQIDQVGGNDAKTYQTGSGHSASIEQIGIGNGPDPILDCPGIADWSPLADFDIAVYNYGTYRIPVTQYQNGTGNVATAVVEGDYNKIGQWQDGKLNVADLDILGDLNQVKQVQLRDDNDSEIDIIGHSNQAGTYQNGFGPNDATININGDFNNAYICQLGSSHTADIVQNGNNNNAYVVQGQ